ncbi:MAG: GNAT family N-acetyltransferase [Bdellovibrionales bacterium]|nr:GNAT family N-acetyltransferase [Bdellovibrionales bacterium]
MTTCTVREAVAADVPAIMELIAQQDMSPDNRLSESEAKRLFEEITNTGCHKLYVAFVDSRLVGTFALVVVQSLTHNGGKSAVVEDVVVRSDVQGHGIGRQMMDYAAEKARAVGAQKVVLSSGQARENAHAFYEHLGYKRDGFRFGLTL